MITYTLKEVSKIINVAPGTLRQWEREFSDLLIVPRSKQGARIYSEYIIKQLAEIKQLYDKKESKETVRQFLLIKKEPKNKDLAKTPHLPIEVISEPVSPVNSKEDNIENAQDFSDAIDAYKKNFLNELMEEIKNVVRKELLEEVKKEINKGSFITVKSLSDSIYKSTANTHSELQELSGAIQKASEQTENSLKYLSNRIAADSIETSEEIFSLSKKLSETSQELSRYVDITNEEISNLTEALEKDREYFVEERDQYRHEIRQREMAFQGMLSSFRDAAAAKEKKWWKFWS